MIEQAGVLLPTRRVRPVTSVLRRVGVAAALLILVVAMVYLDRDGYRDAAGGSMSLLDAVYYSTVTASTTGYGDITPVSDRARLVNVILITPLRVLFLVALVGTTLEVLAERTRQDWKLSRWRAHVREHIVVIGYGTKGRSAVTTLLTTGVGKDSIVVVDPDPRAAADAADAGLVAVTGDATRSAVLRRAGVDRAREVIVATQRDDTAVLVTLTARQLNPGAGIQSAVRESENAPLLRQSGADHVVTSSEAAGRLLGVATSQPHVSEIIEDLLVQGSGLDLTERDVRTGEVGRPLRQAEDPALAVVRNGQVLPIGTAACEHLIPEDRLIIVRPSQA